MGVGGARALRRSVHFREAVTAAARKVNAEARNKAGRRDAGETARFQSVFSKDMPKPGRPRLCLMADDGSDTFRGVHRGAAALAEGARRCYAGMCDPSSHKAGLPEHQALEQSAAFRALARWVDTAALAA
ncbi:TIGR02391 family protein [Streptomyces atacamensis]|jgi:hypothetical protein|uniref:TIGR02391 family protein n=1 Tax=Streptomyces atacamensis TaxID=531966 RepID=UPI00399D45AB